MGLSLTHKNFTNNYAKQDTAYQAIVSYVSESNDVQKQLPQHAVSNSKWRRE